MSDRLTIACAQLNPVMGDLAGNADLLRRARREAARAGADLVVSGELSVCGHPPLDLVRHDGFVRACREAVEALARETADGGPALLVGAPWAERGRLFNAACLLEGGEVAAVRHKVALPAYGAFEELRVFDVGERPGPMRFRGVGLGVAIGDDMWTDEAVEYLEETAAEMVIVPAGSPWWRGKHDLRLNAAVARVTESGLPLLYVNQVGGQDELAFDGASFGLGGDRSLAFQMPAFSSGLAITRWEHDGEGWRCAEGPVARLPEGDELVWLALVQGLRDFAAKTGAAGLVVERRETDLPSAVAAALAADAVGPERVFATAEAAGSGRTTLELAPVDRTELSIGGDGLYRGGDGGFNPLKDVYRTELRRLAEWRNGSRPDTCLGREGVIIEDGIIAAAPHSSPGRGALAGLPAATLDPLLQGLIDENRPPEEIAERCGQAVALVHEVERAFLAAEAGRRRAPPGTRISPRDMGREPRYPLTNRFRDTQQAPHT